jgi:hypothetical protein
MTRKNIQYSVAFQRQVVGEYEAGCSLADLRRKYGINGGGTLRHLRPGVGMDRGRRRAGNEGR